MWYFAAPGNAVRPGKMIHKTLLGEPVLIGRLNTGDVFAVRDVCPHRGIPLSYGEFDGKEVECPYHGWRFGKDGVCTDIPSLVPGQDFEASRIKTKAYPCREVQGNVWVYFGEKKDNLPAIPEVPEIGHMYQFHLSLTFPCNVDHAVIGLMDPAHGPYVHRSPIWRSKFTSYAKEKKFSPRGLGWVMDRHRASKNSKAYKIFLGGLPETEIDFQLPSTRREHAKTDKYTYCGLTACTPVSAMVTEVHHVIYFDVPWLGFFNPLLKLIATAFLGQDGRVVAQQQHGLSFDPTLLLIKDADQMAMWYFKIKKEYLEAQAEGRSFVNPIKECILKWRS